MLGFLKNLFNANSESLKPIMDKGAVIIDVRTVTEFQQGHIPGSRNIPLNEISKKIEQIRKWNKPVITVCQSGVRSASAKTFLATAGIEAYNGGAWANLRIANK